MTRGRLAPSLAVIACLAAATEARAQTTSEKMLAQSLFDEGRALTEQGRWAEACPKFAESQRLDPGGGTLLNLALCHEKEGKVATAFTELGDALSVALKDGRKDREQLARERIAAIGPRIPRVTVRVVEEAPGFEVHLDGSLVRRPAYGVAAGLDPGRHVIEAFAPGRVTFRTEISLAEGEQREVTVPPLAVPRGVEGPAASPAPAAPVPRTAANPVYTTALSVGAAGLVVGGISAAIWAANALTRSANCVEERNYCNSDGLSAYDREKTWAWIATISGAIGLVGMSALIFVPPRVKVTGGIVPGGVAVGLAVPAF